MPMTQQGTILVIDDTPSAIDIVSTLLDDAGYHVSVALTGAEALQRATQFRPDLILLDIRMPEMDGYEICQRLKAQEVTRAIPIIFLSALSETVDKVRGFAAGAVDYLSKPIVREELLARVRTHLTLHFTQQHLAAQNAQLQDYQEHLEDLVNERTAELLAANAALQHEIEGHQRDEELVRKMVTALETMQLGVTIADLDRKIVYVNQAEARLHGYAVEELLGQEVNVLAPPAYRQRLTVAQIDQVHNWTRESLNLRKEGTLFPVYLRSDVVKNEDGQAIAVVTTCEDITERKQAEAELHAAYAELSAKEDALRQQNVELARINQDLRASDDALIRTIDLTVRQAEQLRASEERYRSLFDGVPIGLYRTTPTGQFLDVNPAFVDILRYPDRPTLLAVNNFDLYLTPAERTQWQTMLEREGIVREFETQARRWDGAIIWVRDNGRAVYNDQGQVLWYEGSVEDITDRKETEAELQRYRTHLEELVAERTEALQQEIIERTYVERALQQAKSAAEAANQAKSRFLANMSHELRTPLTAILGFTQLMERDPLFSGKQRENLAIISHSGEHLLNLINDILEFSKIEAGQSALNSASFDLYHTLDDLDEMLRVRADIKGLRLAFACAPEVPQYVATDERKLRQILINLLGNAIKFTAHGSVTLDCRLKEESLSSKHESSIVNLQFTIEDTGPGIAPEEVETLFDAFVQTASGRTMQEGTGLGLAISRQFVRLLGGDLTVTSPLTSQKDGQAGPGSLFTFTIQAECAATAAGVAKNDARRVTALAPNQPAYCLLVVEDHFENRTFLKRLLQYMGFDVREATNGLEALEQYDRWRPHLIWMDMRMPVLDGYEATKKIRELETRSAKLAADQAHAQSPEPGFQDRVPIIALTAHAFEEERAHILAAGCDDLVRKPYHDAEIFEMLRKHLGVDFVYDACERPTAANRRDVTGPALTPEMLAALPAALINGLEQATLSSDVELIEQHIQAICRHNQPAADALASLANRFDHDAILNLIQRTKAECHSGELG